MHRWNLRIDIYIDKTLIGILRERVSPRGSRISILLTLVYVASMSGDTPSRPLPTLNTPTRKTSDTHEFSSEKENQSPKLHRPLPVPKESRPADGPVPTASFYAGSSSKSRAGSSHTTYIPPASPPLTQKTSLTSYREPESIADDMPALEPLMDWSSAEPQLWGSLAPNNDWTSWDTKSSSRVDIDGRNYDEELKWAEPETQATKPGPGLLPPLLSELLHHPDHTLYSVTAAAPTSRLTSAVSSSGSTPVPMPPPSSSSGSSSSPPPTADEIRTAVPHPHAYYCKQHNGWVLLSWCSSQVLPPLSSTFHSEHPLPNQARRKQTISCLSDEATSVGRVNVTHHFHKYAKAVDARSLTTPFKRSEWETEALRKQRRRKMTLHLDNAPNDAAISAEKDEPSEPDLLDLYICCQCSVYCVVSQVIPGVLPLRVLDEFVKDKLEHPQPGTSPELAVVTGFETIITYVLASPAFRVLFFESLNKFPVLSTCTASSSIDYGEQNSGFYLSHEPSSRAS